MVGTPFGAGTWQQFLVAKEAALVRASGAGRRATTHQKPRKSSPPGKQNSNSNNNNNNRNNGNSNSN